MKSNSEYNASLWILHNWLCFFSALWLKCDSNFEQSQYYLLFDRLYYYILLSYRNPFIFLVWKFQCQSKSIWKCWEWEWKPICIIYKKTLVFVNLTWNLFTILAYNSICSYFMMSNQYIMVCTDRMRIYYTTIRSRLYCIYCIKSRYRITIMNHK